MPEEDTGVTSEANVVEEDDIQSDMFQVSVKGTGVELTRTVDQTTALSVIATVLGGGATPPTAVVAPRVPTAAPVSSHRATRDEPAASTDGLDHMTIGEYIDDCGAQPFPAKITAIGRFLELKLGQTSFTKEEVRSQFRPAGEAQPANFHRDFGEAIAQRWIAEEPNEKGQYFVTKTGKAAIAAKFDKSTRRAAPARRKRATGKSDNRDSSSADNSDLQELDDE
ncbi:hypothetical protein [Mycobacterium sp. E342]|uniref:hypothetical protein n=1 Tax=Mycobacterium sp. E342 TaxID=1834147 RepID=UPI000A7C7F8A|nr:hypothetical protein [Mycobacterium sp. E342]